MSDDITADQLTELIEANPMAEETTETTETTESTESEKTATEIKAEEKSNGEDKITEATDADAWRTLVTDADAKKEAERTTDLNAGFKRIAELRTQLSSAITPLGKKPSDEQVTAYRKATGVPETAEGYKFEVPEGHDLTDADTAFQSWAGATFHANLLSADQAKGLNAAWNEFAAATQQAQIDADKAYADETEDALKKDWPGKEFEVNKGIADRTATKLFGDDIDNVREIETKDGRFILDHPALVRVFAKIGREMQEGGLGPVLTDSDRDSVQDKIDDLGKQISKAKVDGDTDKANRLYQEQLALDASIVGTKPVVGAEGRVA